MSNVHLTEKTTIQPLWMSLLRVILGLVLIWKGISFIRDTTALQQLIETTGVGVFSTNSSVLAFIVSYLSVLCGVLILVGLYTRISSIVQIPVLIAAVIFVNIKEISNGLELATSIVTLILLIFFAIKGSGQFSADEYFRTYYRAGSEKGKMDRMFETPARES